MACIPGDVRSPVDLGCLGSGVRTFPLAPPCGGGFVGNQPKLAHSHFDRGQSLFFQLEVARPGNTVRLAEFFDCGCATLG